MQKSQNFKYLRIVALGLVTVALTVFIVACGNRGDKKVYFGNLENYAQVESPFKVVMKAENLIVEPVIMGIREGAGHFHIIIDSPLSPPGAPIPKNSSHIHYGNGESETVLDLPVGEHTLALQFAKGDHVPYDPPIVQLIHITVTKQNIVDTTATKPMDSTSVKPADSTAAMAPANKASTADSTKKISGDTAKVAGVDSSKKAPAKAK